MASRPVRDDSRICHLAARLPIYYLSTIRWIIFEKMSVAGAFFAVSMVLVSCSSSESQDAVVEPVPPAADRQAWGLQLEISEPNLRVEIATPFIQEIGRSTFADSGAAVSFIDGKGRLISQIRAARMDFNSSFLSLSGSVEINIGDSITVGSDTLLWDRAAGELVIAKAVDLSLPRGKIKGRQMKTDLRLDAWSIKHTRELWQANGDSLFIASTEQVGHRDGGEVVVSHREPMARFGALEMRGQRAVYREQSRLLEFDGKVMGADSSHRFHADRLEYDLGERRFDALGEIEMVADSVVITASEFSNEDSREVFRGLPATFKQGRRSVAAQQLSYDRPSGLLEATNDVSFREEDKTLTAQQLAYDTAADSVTVHGPYLLRLPDMSGIAEGGQLAYAVGHGSAVLSGNPVFRRERSDSSFLSISADTITADLKEKQLFGDGSFRAGSTEATATAASGFFEHGRDRLTMYGNVDFCIEAIEDSFASYINADSMIVILDAGKLAQVEIPDSLSGSIAGGAGRTNWISSRSGSINLNGNELKTIELRGGADVIHRKLGEEEMSRFSGKEMTMEFADRLMQRVLVKGEAAVVSRLPKDKEGTSINRAEGERLVIEFSAGEIAEVKLLESIKGKYYLPK